ncbi:MAG TPA: type II secretion system protein [Opitutaceae bacterium]|nr:type II secretion system protein [Opitutaceae bacterium]HRE08072.1 type II secretion system protein [Opitutaceae bacterium]
MPGPSTALRPRFSAPVRSGIGATSRGSPATQRFVRGFTLLEVLCALVVFAMAAAVLGGAYVNVLNAYHRIGGQVRNDDDLRFARAALLAEPDLKKAEEGGRYSTVDGRTVQWEAVIEPTTVTDLFSVRFTCQIDDPKASTPARVEQVFRVLRPTWSEPAERDKLRAEAQKRILELQEKRR